MTEEETTTQHPQMLPSEGSSEAPKLPQYMYTVSATLLVLAGGTTIGWTSPALKKYSEPDSPLTITEDQGSWVGSLLTLGAMVGALPSGNLADLIGRKVMLLAISIPLVISWAMIAFSHSVEVILFARVISGIALGATCSVGPMYISEIADASIRGTLGTYFQLMLVVGILYSFVVGAILGTTGFALACAVVPIVFFGVFFTAPESPFFLLKKFKRAEAEKALKQLRGDKYNVYKELNEIQNNIDNSKNAGTSFIEGLSKRESIRALIICLGLMVFQQLSGINMVMFYVTPILKASGSTLSPELSTIIVGIVQILATYVATHLVEKAGRKLLLLISAIVMFISLAALGQYFHMKNDGSDVSSISFIPLISVVLYIAIFAIGFGPIPWMMTGEILPSDIKGLGTSVAVAVNWMLAFVVTKTFVSLLHSLGEAKTYWLFASICILAAIFTQFVVIETKGKTLQDIQAELSGRNNSSTSQSTNKVV